jgi:hypothetical protein
VVVRPKRRDAGVRAALPPDTPELRIPEEIKRLRDSKLRDKQRKK